VIKGGSKSERKHILQQFYKQFKEKMEMTRSSQRTMATSKSSIVNTCSSGRTETGQCFCSHSKVRVQEREELQQLNRRHLDLLRQHTRTIRSLEEQLQKRKVEKSKIIQEFSSFRAEREELKKDLLEKLSERFQDRERGYIAKISHLEAENSQQQSELRKLRDLENQIEGLERDLARERDRIRILTEENIQLSEKNMILEKTSNDNSFHEILTEIQQIVTENAEPNVNHKSDQELEDLYQIVVQRLDAKDVTGTPYCNETLKELIETLLQRQTDSITAQEHTERLKMVLNEKAGLERELARMRSDLEEATRRNAEMEQRIKDEQAVTRQQMEEKAQILKNFNSCDQSEIDLRADLEVYRKTLDYEESRRSRRTSLTRESSSSSSSSSSDDEKESVIHRPDFVVPVSGRPPSGVIIRRTSAASGSGYSSSTAVRSTSISARSQVFRASEQQQQQSSFRSSSTPRQQRRM